MIHRTSISLAALFFAGSLVANTTIALFALDGAAEQALPIQLKSASGIAMPIAHATDTLASDSLPATVSPAAATPPTVAPPEASAAPQTGLLVTTGLIETLAESTGVVTTSVDVPDAAELALRAGIVRR